MTIVLLVINEYRYISHNIEEEIKMNKNIRQFVKKIEKRFSKQATRGVRDYFLGYGLKMGKKATLNVIIDDRDVERMSKDALIETLQNILNSINPDSPNILPKIVVLSDINEKNVWGILGNSAEIRDVKSLTTFFNITLPEGFQVVFERLPNEFKLDDFRGELKKITNKEHHRNTYQNWLIFLRKAEYVELKDKTYIKTPRFNRNSVLKDKIEKNN